MSRRPRVLVTNGMAEGGAAAVRSLAVAGLDVITCEATRWPLLQSRHARGRHSLPVGDVDALGEALLALVRREEIDVLLPLGAAATEAACTRRADLAAITALNVPTLEAYRNVYVKSACAAACRAVGVPCPLDFDVGTAAEALESGRVVGLVVKPDHDAGAARGVRYARTGDALRAAVAATRCAHGSALIQEYIPGPVEHMKTVVVLYDRHGRLATALTTRKCRQWPPEGGVSAASCSTVDRDLVALVAPLFAHLEWRGPAEVELKYDARDGLHKVIEVNPRFPAYLRFAAHCGLDLPVIAARLALGADEATPPLFTYRAGMPYVSPTAFVRSVLHELRRGPRRLEALAVALRELRGTGALWRELLGDPRPLAGRCLGGFHLAASHSREPAAEP